MKKNLFFVVIMMALLPFSFSSCSSDGKDLVGTWEGIDLNKEVRTFHFDGTVSSTYYFRENVSSPWIYSGEYEGNYSVKGNRITIVFDEPTCDGSINSVSMTYSLKNNVLTCSNEYWTQTFTRIN